ncbi:EF-hand domain-containing protein [Verrucomicrobium spinosum]|uniref:EF-hand domain-containing protein n=1 Tax=Verrucomicrobium spinosum TaxID=2736 RepID=UPI0001745608|nr:EF-hand domain-containing protein [Verrucomicrobium spinosum]
MKTMLTYAAVALTAVLAQASPTATADAHSKADKKDPAAVKSRMEKRFGKLDGNNDGFVTKDEFKVTKFAKKNEAKAEKRFARWDKDHDGKLSKEEWTNRPVGKGKGDGSGKKGKSAV